MIALEDSDGEIQVSDLSNTSDKATKTERNVELCLSLMIDSQLVVFSLGQELCWYWKDRDERYRSNEQKIRNFT